MKTHMKIDSSALDDMDLSITITMKRSQWRDVMRQMPEAWPSSRLGMLISTCLGHVTRATEATYTED